MISFSKVPEFTSSNKKLENYYNRSLINFLLNKWDVDEFRRSLIMEQARCLGVRGELFMGFWYGRTIISWLTLTLQRNILNSF